MTKLLLKLLVKNHRQTQDPAVRSRIGSLAGAVGIFCNAALFILKLMIGLLSGSIAVMADAFNNMTDAAASVTTLLGFRLARQPADRDHPFGHARYEYLSGLVVAALILLIGVELVQSSVSKILSPQAMDVSIVTIVILLLSVGTKLWLYLFYRTLGKMIGSQALRATAADSRNDAIASLGVLLSCVCSKAWGVDIDGYAGLAVAVFILWSGIGIAKETVSPLIGQQADTALLEQLSQLILRHEKILGMHDLLVHDYGPGQCYASVHAEISADEDPLSGHEIIDDIERDAMAKLNVHLVIHYDPVVLHDQEQQRLRQLVTDIAAQIHPELSIHDFRLLRYSRQTRLYFDLEVPYNMSISHSAIKAQIDRMLQQHEPGCVTVIAFDGK